MCTICGRSSFVHAFLQEVHVIVLFTTGPAHDNFSWPNSHSLNSVTGFWFPNSNTLVFVDMCRTNLSIWHFMSDFRYLIERTARDAGFCSCEVCLSTTLLCANNFSPQLNQHRLSILRPSIVRGFGRFIASQARLAVFEGLTFFGLERGNLLGHATLFSCLVTFDTDVS